MEQSNMITEGNGSSRGSVKSSGLRDLNRRPTRQKGSSNRTERMGGAKYVGDQISLDSKSKRKFEEIGSGSGSGSWRRSVKTRVLSNLNPKVPRPDITNPAEKVPHAAHLMFTLPEDLDAIEEIFRGFQASSGLEFNGSYFYDAINSNDQGSRSSYGHRYLICPDGCHSWLDSSGIKAVQGKYSICIVTKNQDVDMGRLRSFLKYLPKDDVRMYFMSTVIQEMEASNRTKRMAGAKCVGDQISSDSESKRKFEEIGSGSGSWGRSVKSRVLRDLNLKVPRPDITNPAEKVPHAAHLMFTLPEDLDAIEEIFRGFRAARVVVFNGSYFYDAVNRNGSRSSCDHRYLICPEDSSGIKWIAVQGKFSICVMTKNDDVDMGRLRSFLTYLPKEDVRMYFMSTIVQEMEDPSSALRSELRQRFEQAARMRSRAAVSVAKGIVEVYEESGHEASATVNFLVKKLKNDPTFTREETVQDVNKVSDMVSHTTLFAIKCRDYIVLGADSRASSCWFGRVTDDDYLKILRLVGSIFMLMSGDPDLAAEVREKVLKLLCNESDIRTLVEKAARFAARAIEESPFYQNELDVGYIIGGASYNENAAIGEEATQFDLFHVFKVAGKNCEVVRKDRVASHGDGEDHLSYFKVFEQDITEKRAIKLVLNGLRCASRLNWTTGGELKAVSVSRHKREKEEMRTLVPILKELPSRSSIPYKWVSGEFDQHRSDSDSDTDSESGSESDSGNDELMQDVNQVQEEPPLPLYFVYQHRRQDGQPIIPEVVKTAFVQINCRREALIKALTSEVKDFIRQHFIREQTNIAEENPLFSLVGLQDRTWTVRQQVNESILDGFDLPLMELDWICAVAQLCDSWLSDVASHLAAAFDDVEREVLLNMVKKLQPVFEIAVEDKARRKASDDDSEGERENKFCGLCENGWLEEEQGREMRRRRVWVCCDTCQTYFHASCADIPHPQNTRVATLECVFCTSGKFSVKYAVKQN